MTGEPMGRNDHAPISAAPGAVRRKRSERDWPARRGSRKALPGAPGPGSCWRSGPVCIPWVAVARAPLPEVAVELVADGLNAPVFLVAPEDGSGRRFVGEQAGEVFVVTAEGERLEPPFLDLRDRMVTLLEGFDERGLLGMAFHPDFASNGLFYVTYSAKLRPGSALHRRDGLHAPAVGVPGRGRRSRPRRPGIGAHPARARLGQPQAQWRRARLRAGRLLYVGMGDGGGVHGVPDLYVPPVNDQSGRVDVIPEDPFTIPPEFHHYDGYAQDLSLLYGKILRLDVNVGRPGYAIPPTNPFVAASRAARDLGLGLPQPVPDRVRPDRQWRPGGLGRRQIILGDNLPRRPAGQLRLGGTRGYALLRPGAAHSIRPRTARSAGLWASRSATRWSSMPTGGQAPRGQGRGRAHGHGHGRRLHLSGSTLPALYGRIVFGDFSTVLERPSGQVFVATPPASWGAHVAGRAPVPARPAPAHAGRGRGGRAVPADDRPGHSGRPDRKGVEAGVGEGQ